MYGDPNIADVTLNIDIPRQRIAAQMTQRLDEVKDAVDASITKAINDFDYQKAVTQAVNAEMTRAITEAVTGYLRYGEGNATVTSTVAAILAPILAAVKANAPDTQKEQPIGIPQEDVLATWRFTVRSELIGALGGKVAHDVDLIAVGNDLADTLAAHWTASRLK